MIATEARVLYWSVKTANSGVIKFALVDQYLLLCDRANWRCGVYRNDEEARKAANNMMDTFFADAAAYSVSTPTIATAPTVVIVPAHLLDGKAVGSTELGEAIQQAVADQAEQRS